MVYTCICHTYTHNYIICTNIAKCRHTFEFPCILLLFNKMCTLSSPSLSGVSHFMNSMIDNQVQSKAINTGLDSWEKGCIHTVLELTILR